MKKIIYFFVAAVMMVGCESRQSQEPAKQQPQQALHKENPLTKQIAQKLVVAGKQQLLAGNVNDAVGNFKTAIAQDPQNAQAYLSLAEIFMRMEKYDEAITVLENATKYVQDNGMIYYFLGLSNQVKGNPLPALLSTRHAAELFRQKNDLQGLKRAMILLQTLNAQAQAQQQPVTAAQQQPQSLAEVVNTPIPQVTESQKKLGRPRQNF